MPVSNFKRALCSSCDSYLSIAYFSLFACAIDTVVNNKATEIIDDEHQQVRLEVG